MANQYNNNYINRNNNNILYTIALVIIWEIQASKLSVQYTAYLVIAQWTHSDSDLCVQYMQYRVYIHILYIKRYKSMCIEYIQSIGK